MLFWTEREWWKKEIYWKMIRGLLLICPHESETQTSVILTTS